MTLEDENELILVGLMAMIDPPRKEVKQAVADVNLLVSNSYDHRTTKTTAVAIAQEIGISAEGDLALTGTELMPSETELADQLYKNHSLCRVSPENKNPYRAGLARQRQDLCHDRGWGQ